MSPRLRVAGAGSASWAGCAAAVAWHLPGVALALRLLAGAAFILFSLIPVLPTVKGTHIMGFLAAGGYDGTETIQLGNGYWARVKKSMNEAEMGRVEAYLGGGRQRVEVAGDSRFADVDLRGSRRELVVASLVDWNVDGPPLTRDGEPWPLTPDKGPWSPGCPRRQSVAALPDPVFQQIWKVCDDLNAPRSKEDEQTFRPGSGGGDQNEVSRPAGVPEVPDGTGDVAPAWPFQYPAG